MKAEEKIQELDQDKIRCTNENSRREIEFRMKRFINEADIVKRELDFQTRTTYDIMEKLVTSMSNMLNPVLTKFIQINTMFYSKSIAINAPIGSIDPNAGLAADVLKKQSTHGAKMKAIDSHHFDNDFNLAYAQEALNNEEPQPQQPDLQPEQP